MAKTIGQIRYYGEGSPKNFPKTLTGSQLTTGLAFTNLYPITQLGVQTLPGTEIFINNHTKPIVVGQTGIYELNIQGNSNINYLKVGPTTINLINSNRQSPTNAYIIIDYISEREV